MENMMTSGISIISFYNFIFQSSCKNCLNLDSRSFPKHEIERKKFSFSSQNPRLKERNSRSRLEA